MAIRLPGRNTIDINPRKAVGVSIPFSAQGVFTSTYTTADQLNSNLLNYFMTDPTERYMNVNFGFGIRRVLFEQMTDATTGQLKSRIESDLKVFFPNVQVVDLKITPADYSPNTLVIFLKYQVASTGIQDTLNFTVTQP